MIGDAITNRSPDEDLPQERDRIGRRGFGKVIYPDPNDGVPAKVYLFQRPVRPTVVTAPRPAADVPRLTFGPIQNPVRGILHGLAALLSLAGLVMMVQRRGSGALVLYGLALVGLYTVSTLYHAIPWSPRWKLRWQRLDHTCIYVLVAGTFTPLAAGVLDGTWLRWNLILVWSLALIGVAREFWAPFRRRWSLLAQLVVGAGALGPILQMFTRMDQTTMMLTVGGGAVYLGGVVMFVNSWPKMLPGIFSYHELFHVLVVVASVAHFAAVWQVWIPPS